MMNIKDRIYYADPSDLNIDFTNLFLSSEKSEYFKQKVYILTEAEYKRIRGLK